MDTRKRLRLLVSGSRISSYSADVDHRFDLIREVVVDTGSARTAWHRRYCVVCIIKKKKAQKTVSTKASMSDD